MAAVADSVTSFVGSGYATHLGRVDFVAEHCSDLDTGRYGDGLLTIVAANAPTVEEIESVFGVLDDYRDEIRTPPPPEPIVRPRIFVGHGGDEQWRVLRDHLADPHGFDVQSFESGSRAGHTIRDILNDLLETSTIALLVLTGEDAMGDGAIRARQNVIHEAGLFQGKLGWDRAILLVEEGVEGFSNEQGIVQIRFDKGQIRQTFGDVVTTIHREFPGTT